MPTSKDRVGSKRWVWIDERSGLCEHQVVLECTYLPLQLVRLYRRTDDSLEQQATNNK